MKRDAQRRLQPLAKSPPFEKPAPEGARHRSGQPPREAPAHTLLLPAWRTTRVTKTMWPPSGGTVQFTALHGPELVCVRYRQDGHGLYRYTTIELIVDAAPVSSTKARTQRLQVPIAYEEVELRAQARSLGAKWLPDRRIWELSGHAIQELNLAHRLRRPRRK